MKIIVLNQEQVNLISEMLEREKLANKDVISDNTQNFDDEDKKQSEEQLKLLYSLEYSLEIGDIDTDYKKLDVIKYILNLEEEN